MKKAVRFLATVLAAVIIAIALDFITDGIPLFGVPKPEEIASVAVEHGEFPGSVRELTDEDDIELAVALTGYLRYTPLKSSAAEEPLITITYRLQNGSEIVISASHGAVWQNGKAYALRHEDRFVKMCTGLFFPVS